MTRPGGLAGWVDRLLERFLDSPCGRAIRADLHEEMGTRAERDGAAPARRWFLWQAVTVLAWALLDRVRGRGWRNTPTWSPRYSMGGLGPFPRDGVVGLDLSRRFHDSLRVFRRSPAYAAAIVGTLGIALGLTLSVLAAVNGVLLTELPYVESEGLVRIDRVGDDGLPDGGGVSFPDLTDWSTSLRTATGVEGWHRLELTSIEGGVADVWTGTATTPGMLELLGVRPFVGTLYDLEAGEGLPGETSVYLAHALWRRRFGGDPSIVGHTITLSERSWTVRGVMPPGFAFPDASSDFWAPLPRTSLLPNRAAGFLTVLARLSPGQSLDAARAEISSVVAEIDRENGSPHRAVAVRPLAEVVVGPVRRSLWVLLAAVCFFLLVACANVAGLSLSRVEGRRRELSVRRSLGATGGQIWRELIVEAVALSIAGAALGAVLALGGVQLLLALAPADLPRRDEVALDPSVLGVGFLLAVVCGVAFGLIPGFRGRRLSVAPLRSHSGSLRGQQHIHHLIAGAQVALAVLLLSGSGLLLRSFQRLTAVETGMADPAGVLTAQLSLGRERWRTAEGVIRFHRRLLEETEALPGVRSAAITTHLPFSGTFINAAVVPEGQVYRRDSAVSVEIEVVGGDYFGALGIQIVRGRGFAPAGELDGRSVVINETAARLLFPGKDPIGQSFSFDVEEGERSSAESQSTVIGVAADVLDHGLDRERSARAYYGFPSFRRRWGFLSGRFFFMAVRTESEPMSVLGDVRRVVAAIDPVVPVRDPQTLEGRMLATVRTERFRTVTLTFFAVLATIVSAIGIHGVVALGVRRGMREIGVRMALGEGSASVRRRILWSAGVITFMGSTVGIGATILVAPVFDAALFGVPTHDPATMIAVVATTLLSGMGAAWRPALRASRVDPIDVLRED